jgi:hypothetical protein
VCFFLAVCCNVHGRHQASAVPLSSQCYVAPAAAADMWVAFAGPLTHIPMTAFWVGLLIAATYIAYGTTAIQLAWPYPLTYKNLGVAVCVGSILVSAASADVVVAVQLLLCLCTVGAVQCGSTA